MLFLLKDIFLIVISLDNGIRTLSVEVPAPRVLNVLPVTGPDDLFDFQNWGILFGTQVLDIILVRPVGIDFSKGPAKLNLQLLVNVLINRLLQDILRQGRDQPDRHVGVFNDKGLLIEEAETDDLVDRLRFLDVQPPAKVLGREGNLKFNYPTGNPVT